MSSRFFAGAGSSSESEGSSSADELQYVGGKKTQQHRKFMEESGSEDEYSDSDAMMSDAGSEVEEVAVDAEELQRQKEMESRRSRFLVGAESESEEEEAQRVVKSQKDKLYEELDAIRDTMGDGIDEDDWMEVADDFERLVKTAGKALRYGLPETFFDFVDFLEDVLTDKTPEQLKKLKADDARALNALKQRFKKTDFSVFKRESEVAGTAAAAGLDHAAQPSQANQQLQDEEITPSTIPQRVQEIMGTRGRKKGERAESIALLRRCLAVADTFELRGQVLVALLSSQLDQSLTAFSAPQLATLVDDAALLVDILCKHEEGVPAVTTLENGEISQSLVQTVSFGSLLKRCDEEMSIAMNTCDHHSPAYLELVKVELKLISLISRVLPVFKHYSLDEFMGEAQMRLLHRTYYRSQTCPVPVESLLKTAYQSGQDSLQLSALLYHVTILASRGRYAEARQLFTTSRVSDSIAKQSPATQILYNRTLVHLGIAAFRAGLFADSYFCLQEICSSGRPKELLGQAVAYADPQGPGKRQEGERQEKARLIPHHLHFNVELVDSIFSIVSMVLELPQSAAQHAGVHQPAPRKVFQSRHLKRILDAHERSLFNGPPENSRETIVAASRALAGADWRKCVELLSGGSVKLWTGLSDGETVRQLVMDKVRRSALLVFLYTFAPQTSTISVNYLCTKFDLSDAVVRACLLAHPMIAADAADQDKFSWKEASRKDYMERTTALLREAVLGLYPKDGEIGEFVAYGASSSDISDLFDLSRKSDAPAASSAPLIASSN